MKKYPLVVSPLVTLALLVPGLCSAQESSTRTLRGTIVVARVDASRVLSGRDYGVRLLTRDATGLERAVKVYGPKSKQLRAWAGREVDLRGTLGPDDERPRLTLVEVVSPRRREVTGLVSMTPRGRALLQVAGRAQPLPLSGFTPRIAVRSRREVTLVGYYHGGERAWLEVEGLRAEVKDTANALHLLRGARQRGAGASSRLEPGARVTVLASYRLGTWAKVRLPSGRIGVMRWKKLAHSRFVPRSTPASDQQGLSDRLAESEAEGSEQGPR